MSLKRLTWSWQFPFFKSLLGAAVLPAISLLRIQHLCSVNSCLPLFCVENPDSFFNDIALSLISFPHFYSSTPSLWQNRFLLHPCSYCTLYNLYCSSNCISIKLCFTCLPCRIELPEKGILVHPCVPHLWCCAWLIVGANKCLWIYSEADFVLK